MEEYKNWDLTAPGISFSARTGRITIFKTTIEALGHPEYFHFRFSPEVECYHKSRVGKLTKVW